MTQRDDDSDPATGPRSRAEIAARVVLLRKRMMAEGESAKKFAERHGFTQSAWSNYEKHTRRMSLQSARMIKDRFRVTLDWLYDGDTSGLPRDVFELITEK